MQFWRMSGGATSEMDEYSAKAHMAAITDQQGRIMVLMTHNTDIADSWEREAEDRAFFLQFSPEGYAVGINAALYAMSH
jgi:phosphoribosylformylglycinamidine (FGAM) synthase-like amidotransferase family enzyme